MTLEEMEKYRGMLMQAYSADLYDVLDKMGYSNQCLDLGISPLNPLWKIAGPAFTIWGIREPRFDAALPRPDFDDHALFNRIYPGCVVVINDEKDQVVGHWGEMMSYGARAAGAVGAVIDGGTRDKPGILQIENWTCFARYTSPIESKSRWRPRETQIPIYMTGSLTQSVLVRPGDWLFGDVDGVLVIPEEILGEAATRVCELARLERLSRTAFREGASFREVYEKYRRA